MCTNVSDVHAHGNRTSVGFLCVEVYRSFMLWAKSYIQDHGRVRGWDREVEAKGEQDKAELCQ